MYIRCESPRQVRPLHRDLAGRIVIRAHRRRAGEITEALSAVAGPNIRVLYQRKRAVPRRRMVDTGARISGYPDGSPTADARTG